MQVAKWLVFLLCLGPALRGVIGAATNSLGANPVEFLTRSSGTWTLVFLCVTLAVTPVRRLTGLSWLAGWRRMFGLYTFFYALLHLTTYVWLDQWFDWMAIVKDIVKRPFITVGFAAFVLLLPLALTSTRAMMRRLGRRWQQLHRVIYLIAPLGVLHYWWHKSAKNDLSEPAIYGAIVLALLAARLAWRLNAAARKPPG